MLIRIVSSSQVIDLRHRVLRAGMPRDTAIFPGDDEPTTFHLAAFDADETVVGCVTLLRRSLYPTDPPAWQLRGMAVAPEVQRAGVGAALMEQVESTIARSNFSRQLWCNARVPAVAFYTSQGWTPVGEVFDYPTAGPHQVMMKRLD